jgi:hypothetical protein
MPDGGQVCAIILLDANKHNNNNDEIKTVFFKSGAVRVDIFS